jgi:hypothetical protein
MIISPDVVSLDQGSMICGRRHRNPFRYNGFIFTTVSNVYAALRDFVRVALTL